MSVLELDRLSKSYPNADQPAVERLSIEVVEGEILTLLGESGSGKTTTLRLIAGFERPDSGTVRIGDRIVAGGEAFVPPEERGVRVVFQESTLFPHLSVWRNVAFALNGQGRRQKRRLATEALSLVGLPQQMDRYPHELSGGERQRVELARALVSRPALLLMDEPFSNLDEMLKAQLREEVDSILRKTGSTAVLVTHDIDDAMAVSDRVAVLREGCLQQLGRPEDVYRCPANGYVACLLGAANLIEARRSIGGFQTPFGWIESRKASQAPSRAVISVRPEAFVLCKDGKAGITGKVEKRTFLGRHQEIVLRIDDGPRTQRLRIHLDAAIEVSRGESLTVRPRAEDVHLLG